MTNWEFFKENNRYVLKYLKKPTIYLVDDREDNAALKRYKEAIGYYECEDNSIFVLKKFDCLAIRLHEYGHWVIVVVYFLLEVFWEFLWWGCSIRELFIKKVRKEVIKNE